MAYPCIKRSEVGYTLRRFSDDVRISDQLRSDLPPEITRNCTYFQAQVKRLRIDLTDSKVERSNQNISTDGEIGYLKNHFCQKFVSKKYPKGLRGYDLVHQAGILSRTDCEKTG